MPKVIKSSISFNITPYSPNDLKKNTKKDYAKWRNFTFKGKVPTFDNIKELAALVGDDKFNDGFKSFYHGVNINYKDKTFSSYETAKIVFKCNEDLMHVICDFFNEGGFVCDITLVTFSNKEMRE